MPDIVRGVYSTALLLVMAGCVEAAAGTKPIVKTADSGPPATIGFLYPQVEPGAADGKGKWLNDRKYMASEIGAIVHVQVRDVMARVSAPELKDLSADVKLKSRIALLGSSVHREYSLNGVIPKSRANELGRAANATACLLVSIIKFGPSNSKLELKSIGGLIKPVETTVKASSWINCGVVAVVFKTPGGGVLWEAGHLSSLPADTTTQEQVAERCIAELFAAWPWKP